MKNRIKTYSFWVSLSGAVVIFMQAIGRAVGFIPNTDVINNIIMSVAGILVVFGIVASPTEEELKIIEEDCAEDDDKKDEEESDNK